MNAIVNINLIKSLSEKRIINIIKVLSSFIASVVFKRHFLWGKPFILTIEPTDYCNLGCSQCVTGSGKLRRTTGKMSFPVFKEIINELGDELCYLVLFNQGEPFLNNELINFISYAKRKNIYVITSTNGHFLSESDIAEQLISSELDSIIISLDGADENIYRQYRIGGDFKKVIAGTKKLVHFKKLAHRMNPKICLQFLIMKHNEHQLTEIRGLATELGVDKLLFKTVQVYSYKEAQKLLPKNKKWSRYNLNKNKLQLKQATNKPCSRLWTSSTILWDGTIVPCCFDKNGKYAFGNLTHQHSFKQIWWSAKYERFRKTNIKGEKSIDLCTNCTQGQKVYL